MLRTCADLVRNCVAVGHLKPCVVLLVEAAADDLGGARAAEVKAEILRRTAPFNSRLLDHERVADPARIVVVPAGSLPRTSVRRAAPFAVAAAHCLAITAGKGEYQVCVLVSVIGAVADDDALCRRKAAHEHFAAELAAIWGEP